MKPSTDFSRLSFVPFSKFDLWDVKRYTYNSNLNGENFVILSSLLKPYKKSVSKDEMIKNKWQIISKINFGGELFLRDFDEINSYKGNLFLVPQNSIIYSKINVRHGCIYFNDKEGTPFGVSNEYPIFNFDDSKVDGRFLQKLLRTGTFKNLLNSKTSGISKARVKQEEFLSIEIPLPTLAEQRIIVDAYERKINEAKTLELNAENLESEIERYFIKELGITAGKNNEELTHTLRLVDYKDIIKWSLNHLYRSKTYDFTKSLFQLVKLKNVLVFFEGGKTPSKSNKDFWFEDVFWTSPKDFTNKLYLEKSVDKVSYKAIKETSLKIYPPGTILSVFRSGILRHSFPTIITRVETTINQDLKAYKFNTENVNKLYYLFFVNIFQKFFLERASKKSVTVESINTEEFLEIEIPLPPLKIQERIADHISILKSEIEAIKRRSEELMNSAEREFEETLFN